MRLPVVLICALTLSALGCGDSGDGGGLSALFDALNGDYLVREESDCVIALRGSRFETRMSTGETTCTESYVYGDAGPELAEIETLRVSGTLSDTRLTGTLFNEESFPEVLFDSDCIMRHGERNEITASAEKLSSRSVEGRFAGLAGTWQGQVEITETQWYTDCDGNEDEDNEKVGVYTFTADVSGSSIDVTFEHNGDSESFEVLSSSSGDLIVDNELVHFESE